MLPKQLLASYMSMCSSTIREFSLPLIFQDGILLRIKMHFQNKLNINYFHHIFPQYISPKRIKRKIQQSPQSFFHFNDMMNLIHKAIKHLQIILHILRSHIDIIAEISLKRILTDLKVST